MSSPMDGYSGVDSPLYSTSWYRGVGSGAKVAWCEIWMLDILCLNIKLSRCCGLSVTGRHTVISQRALP